MKLPGLAAGLYHVVLFDTRQGRVISERQQDHAGGALLVDCGLVQWDVAVAVVGRPLAPA